MPRLVHDAGDALLVGGIAQDEAVLLTVGVHPLEERGLFQIACLDLIELVGDVGAQAELVLARAGTGDDAGGCGLVTTALPDLAGEEVRLLAVAAVRARQANAQPLGARGGDEFLERVHGAAVKIPAALQLRQVLWYGLADRVLRVDQRELPAAGVDLRQAVVRLGRGRGRSGHDRCGRCGGGLRRSIHRRQHAQRDDGGQRQNERDT